MEGLRLTITYARELRAEIRRLQSDLTAALDIAEASARQCEKMRAAITRALDACPYCRARVCTAPAHDWLRDALAPVEEPQT